MKFKSDKDFKAEKMYESAEEQFNITSLEIFRQLGDIAAEEKTDCDTMKNAYDKVSILSTASALLYNIQSGNFSEYEIDAISEVLSQENGFNRLLGIILAEEIPNKSIYGFLKLVKYLEKADE